MKNLKYLAGAVLTAMAIFACDNDSLEIGNSLTNESDKLDLGSDIFNVETQTIVADSVLALSTNCFFGRVKDPETGADVTSEFTTQFHLLDNVYISPETNIVGRFDGRASADSCDIIIYLSSPFIPADSLMAIKMLVSELSTPMEEGLRYYSNLDPRAEGMLRADGVKQSKMFSYRNLTDNDSVRNTSTYINNIRITLNRPYKAPDGTTYNNYGSYLMRNYYDHNEFFRSSYAFIHNVCPGFFFEITDGYGFHARVTDIGLRIYYRVATDSSVVNAQLTLAGTKEVLQTTHITNDRPVLDSLRKDTQYTYLKTPAGLFTEVTIPVDQVKSNTHSGDSLVGAKLTFQRVNNNSFDNRVMSTPSSLLLVQYDNRYSFFENNEVPDNRRSYYVSFNSGMNTYSFDNVSNLITELWNDKQTGLQNEIDSLMALATDKEKQTLVGMESKSKEAQIELLRQHVAGQAGVSSWLGTHPNWDKMVLVPITYTTSSTSSGITNVQHDMSLNCIKLVGGKDNVDNPVQLSVVYAKFK